MTHTRQNIFPALRYADAWQAIGFLERAFGFTRQAVFEGPGHTVAHAELSRGTASVGLNSIVEPNDDNPWTKVRCGIYVVLPDAAAVDAHFARASAGGARIAQAVRDTDYGSHDYAAWDIGGHLWAFGTYTNAVPGDPDLAVGLRYDDEGRAADWLQHVFGFTRRRDVASVEGALDHVELTLEDSTLLVAGAAHATTWRDERQATCIHVDDADAHARIATAAGATILAPVAGTSSGARAYTARDPEGFVWTFTTRRFSR